MSETGTFPNGTIWWLSPDGLTLWIENEILDEKRFEEKGYHVGHERVLFPSKDRIAGEKTYSRLKSREHFNAWAFNPKVFFDVYTEFKIEEKKYNEYIKAISPHLSWMTEEIAKSPDGKIRLLIKDLKEKMGPQFLTRHDMSIFMGLQYVLFHEGLFVESGTTLKKEKILIIRFSKPEDSLPRWQHK